MASLNRVAVAADEVSPDTHVAWTGCTMKVPRFAEHMREELVLHGWDITGDPDVPTAFQAALAEPWMTTHSVLAVGRPLLAKGARQLAKGEQIDARLREWPAPTTWSSAPTPTAPPSRLKIPTGRPRGKPMRRHEYCRCGGRRPGNPARICSRVGPEALGRVRRLLSGY